jgi:hypothetical protein
MLATLDVWARDASFGLARVEQGQVPSGSGTTIAGVSSHHLLTDLTAFDDHSQYLLLAGRGGQTISDVVTFSASAGHTIVITPSSVADANSKIAHANTDTTSPYGLTLSSDSPTYSTTMTIYPHDGVSITPTNTEAQGIGIFLTAGHTSDAIFVRRNSAFIAGITANGYAYSKRLQLNGSTSGMLTLVPQAVSATLSGQPVLVGNAASAAGVLGTSNLTAQTGSVGATTLLTGAADTAGMYRVSVYLKTTTAGGGGASVKATVAWNDGTAQTLDVPLIAAAVGVAHDLTVLNAHSQGSVVLNLAASQNITYTTTFTAGTGSPAYEIHVRTEALG